MLLCWLLLYILMSGNNGQLKSKGFNYCSDKTYNTANHQLILDSINIVNGSLEIEFDIKVNKYCDSMEHSCVIIHIDDLISLSINSVYNVLIISVNNENVKYI
eukprot:337736_1